MYYHKMHPVQIREAIRKNAPIVLAVGTIEYHSEHLPLGVDGLVVEGCLDRLEKRRPELVVMPPLYYGVSSFAVAGPENGQGTIDMDSLLLCRFAENIFRDLLDTGWRNIHAFIKHQGENFQQGMPTDLALRLGAKRAIFAHMEKNRGRGWWGDSSMSNYYDGNNVFNWIQVHTPAFEVRKQYGGDHAGRMETSATMALFPETVHMELHDPNAWYARGALKASPELGESYISDMVDSVERLLFGENIEKKETK